MNPNNKLKRQFIKILGEDLKVMDNEKIKDEKINLLEQNIKRQLNIFTETNEFKINSPIQNFGKTLFKKHDDSTSLSSNKSDDITQLKISNPIIKKNVNIIDVNIIDDDDSDSDTSVDKDTEPELAGDLEEDDLEVAKLEVADLEEDDLEEDDLEVAELEEDDLEEDDLEEDDLEDDLEEDLEAQDYEDADLKDADLKEEDLESQDLEEEDLEAQDLEEEDLESQDLEAQDFEAQDFEEEDLEDEEKNSYIYKEIFNTDYSVLNKEVVKGTKINICVYKINKSCKYPFIQYFFYKFNQKDSEELIFPYFKYEKKDTIENESDIFFKKIMRTTEIVKTKGYIKYNKKINLFYELPEMVEKIEEKKRKDLWWWLLIDEIVNKKKILNFEIDKNVTDMFIKNKDLCYLYKKDLKNVYETPSVLFHGTEISLKDSIIEYGLKKSTLFAMMGPYYYFGSFKKSVRYAGWTSTYKTREINGKKVADENGKYENGIIIRFVVYLENLKVLRNHPLDIDDTNKPLTKGYKENPDEIEYRKLLLKLHDYNGLWTETHDSVYVGKAKLSNGKRFMENYEFVVKDSKNFEILTTHILDKNTLERKWVNNKKTYNIL